MTETLEIEIVDPRSGEVETETILAQFLGEVQRIARVWGLIVRKLEQ